MSMNDPIADMITRIRNGQHAMKAEVRAPHSNKLQCLVEALQREGYIRGARVEDIGNNKRELIVELKYFEGKPAIRKITRISKCGRRQYASVAKMPRVRNGLGTSILSTSKGVLSDFEARAQNVGGEILCSVF